MKTRKPRHRRNRNRRFARTLTRRTIGTRLHFEPLEDRRMLAMINVTSTLDNLTSSDSQCTLREAINNANANGDTTGGDCDGGTGADTIVLGANTYTLSRIGNEDNNATGDLDVRDPAGLLIEGNGATIDADGIDGVLHIPSGTNAELTINNATVTGGNTVGGGGGIFNSGGTLTLTNSTVSGNSASFSGGGISNYGGTVTLTGSSVDNNQASSGGGIRISGGTVTLTGSSIDNNQGSIGGGIYCRSGRVTLTDSSMNNNQASSRGGGISQIGSGCSSSSIVNSTISGNRTNGDGGGADLLRGSAIIINSTIVNNLTDADGDGSGGYGGGLSISSRVTLYNTIIAGNGAGSAGQVDNDIYVSRFVTLTASSHNLIGDPNSAGGLTTAYNNILGDGSGGLLPLSSIVGPLADNGGPTQTHLLQPNSPAIDAGDNANAVDPGSDQIIGGGDDTPLQFDQRGTGFDRVENSTVDIGAFEFGAGAPAAFVKIIDNGDAGFSASTFEGFGVGYNQWTVGYEGNLHYHAASGGLHTATWTFDGLDPGIYQVAATWVTDSNRATSAPFTVGGVDNGGTKTIYQRTAPSTYAASFEDQGRDWVPLDVGGNGGNFLLSGSTLTVTLGTSTTGYVIADAVRIEKLPMLLAAEEEAISAQWSVISDGWSGANSGLTLDAGAVADVVAAGAAEWSRVDPSAAAQLSNVTVQIANLPGNVLGLASESTGRIWIDTNAAGHGWAFNQKSQIANPNFVDLLTVVTHELGHVLGLPDLDPLDHPGDVMAGRLDTGLRRVALGVESTLNLAFKPVIDPVPARMVIHSSADRLFADLSSFSNGDDRDPSVEVGRRRHDDTFADLNVRPLAAADTLPGANRVLDDEEDRFADLANRQTARRDEESADQLFAELFDELSLGVED